MSTIRLATTRNAGAIASGFTQWISFGIGRSSTATTDGFMQDTMRTGGILSNLSVRVTANTTTGDSRFRWRINGGYGNQDIVVGAGLTGVFTDAIHTDTVTAGDITNIEIAPGAGGAITTISNWADFAATSNTSERFVINDGTTYPSASTTYYLPVGGFTAGAITTEANTQFKFKTAGTLKNLQVYVRSNGSANATIIGSRIGGVNGNLSISIPGSQTGHFEDTGHSDSISIDNLANLYLTTSTGTVSFRPQTLHVDFETTNNSLHYINNRGAGVTVNAGVTTYFGMSGGLDTSTTESDYQFPIGHSLVLSNIGAYISANGITAATTIKTRVTAGDGNQSLSIGSGLTGYFEEPVLHTDNVTSAQNVDYQIITGGSGTTITINTIGVLATMVKSVADAAIGVDSSALAASLGLTDSILGGDFIGLAAALQLLDSGLGTDEVTLITSILKSIADAGFGTDGLNIQVSLSVPDTGFGDQGTGIEVILTLVDSGSGSDTLSGLAASLGMSETGNANDLLTLLASLSLSDTGAGADSVTVTTVEQIIKTIQDAGLGSDSLSISASLSVVDLGDGQDALSIQVTLTVLDSGTGIDLESVTKFAIIVKSIVDLASGSDSLIISASLNVPESAAGYDDNTLQALLSTDDIIIGSDGPSIQASLTVIDTSSSTEAISILQAIIKIVQDLASGNDFVGSISASIPVSETGLGADIIGQLLASLVVNDYGSGVDVVVKYDTSTQIIKISFIIRKTAITFALKKPEIEFALKTPSISFSMLTGGSDD